MTHVIGMAKAPLPTGTTEPARATGVRPQPGRGDRGEPSLEPASENTPVPAPTGSKPAVAGLYDQIETWVNEGGAGDDVAQ